MPTFSLCMIVKNEAATLDRCLSGIADLMDEIIIVDTGSTDDTKAIAAKYTDRIYDYAWRDNFSDARNYSFSKANCDYIYAPDADEVIDKVNHDRFMNLKACLTPEIEIVQMKYVTVNENDAILNARKEYRAKLFKRLRTFTWVDPIHETVRLDPIVYESDIEILHMPTGSHGKRDFSIFLKTWRRYGSLSDKIRSMLAKELLKVGTVEDLREASCIFMKQWLENPLDDAGKEAAAVLARLARLEGDATRLMKFSLRDMMQEPSSEVCYELGEHFREQKDYDEAIIWFYNAWHETGSILDIHTSGDLCLKGLVECYDALIKTDSQKDDKLLEAYKQQKKLYEDELSKWRLPEELN